MIRGLPRIYSYRFKCLGPDPLRFRSTEVFHSLPTCAPGIIRIASSLNTIP